MVQWMTGCMAGVTYLVRSKATMASGQGAGAGDQPAVRARGRSGRVR